jgi:hypothetical protein
MPFRNRLATCCTRGYQPRNERTARALCFAIIIVGGIAMAIEKPRSEIVARYADFELRQYPSYIVAETDVEGDANDVGNEGFRRLAGYIFGKNGGAKKLAMTAPVTQEANAGTKIAMTAPVAQEQRGPRSWEVQFMMPAEYTLATLPAPDDARVHLRELPARRLAAITYSGTWSQSNYQEHLDKLRAGMQRESLVGIGEPIWARYDPPFKPWFMRTNEIFIEVRTP